MSQQVIDALKRLTKLSIAEVGDACKDDLKLVAVSTGLSDTQIHENFPEFFREEEFSDPDTYHEKEEDSEDDSEELELETESEETSDNEDNEQENQSTENDEQEKE